MGVIHPSSPFLPSERLIQSTTLAFCGFTTFCSAVTSKHRLTLGWWHLPCVGGIMPFPFILESMSFLWSMVQSFLFPNYMTKTEILPVCSTALCRRFGATCPSGSVYTVCSFQTLIVNPVKREAESISSSSFSTLKGDRLEVAWI